MTEINNEYLKYKVGGLLYTPAVNETFADKILNGTYNYLTSVAICLEDAIMESALEQAEEALMRTLEKLYGKSGLPLIFVRVRNPHHLERLSRKLNKYSDIITGYIMPKFDMSNGEDYLAVINEINRNSSHRIYAMPILESASIADKITRMKELTYIKELLLGSSEYILNVRVGGNDFCNLYGLRRSSSQTIYDVGVVRDILADIVNVFARDFVVSGAVWEYFGTDYGKQWANGLKQELELDRINGFVGKTAVHPSQLPLIFESLKVSAEDYNDALSVLSWKDECFGVEKSGDGSRMNEVKCHMKWAKQVKILGEVYGIKEEAHEKFVQISRRNHSS